MDRNTYMNRYNELHGSLIDNYNEQIALFNNRENSLLEDSDRLTHLREEERSIERKLRELRQSVEHGFDYVRRGSRITNRFLPPVPPGQIDVTEKSFEAHTSYPRVKAVAMAAISAAVLTIFFVTSPSLFTWGILSLFNDNSSIPGPTTIGFVAAIYGVMGFMLLMNSIINTPEWYSLQTDTHKHFFLGAEDWTPAQRLQSSLVYSVASAYSIMLPVAIIPFRFVTSLVMMHVYVSSYRQRIDANEAFSVSLRFTNLFNRVFVAILGLLLLTVCYILLQS
jgi:hypothetical protein